MVLLIIFLLPVLSFSQNSQPLLISKMGIVAELMSIKMNAEVALSMVESDTLGLINKKDKAEMLEGYSKLRLASIPIIAQLIADISQKNSLKIYKNLDALLIQKSIQDIDTKDIGDDRTRAYMDNIKAVHMQLVDFYTKAYDLSHIKVQNPKMPAVGDITGIFSAIETAVKDFDEAKDKKVDKIVAILDATKIADSKELTEGASAKKDKGKEA